MSRSFNSYTACVQEQSNTDHIPEFLLNTGQRKNLFLFCCGQHFLGEIGHVSWIPQIYNQHGHWSLIKNKCPWK